MRGQRQKKKKGKALKKKAGNSIKLGQKGQIWAKNERKQVNLAPK